MSPRPKKKHPPQRASRRKKTSAGRAARWMRYGLAVLLCAGLAATGYAFQRYLEETRCLYVRTIRIQGTTPDIDREVLERSGITQGDHILFLDPRKAQKRVETLPFVRRCEVTRLFPDTVVIRVEVREAAAVLMSSGRLFSIDREGVPIAELPNTAALPGVFISEVPGLGVVTLGEPIGTPALEKGLAVLDAFSRTQMAREVHVSEIAARHPNDVRMYCDELGFEIRWGRSGLEEQALRLDQLWAHEQGHLDFDDYCDLRFGMNVACR